MARVSRLPQGGGNLFQMIKAWRAAAEAAGKQIINLGVGQPSGPALMSARQAAASHIMDGRECMHEYADNGVPPMPDWARRFVQCHVASNLSQQDISYLPIPGIKPMLGLIPLACGADRTHQLRVSTMTNPGYPTPAVWATYLGLNPEALYTTPENGFLFPMAGPNGVIHDRGGSGGDERLFHHPDLLTLNYPHNPTGQVATREFWHELCAKCVEYKIRVFNDAAYAILAHAGGHCTLTDVAVDYPELSWVEAFSGSKAGNFTGWRIGAIAGSPDFVGDIATIKGNTDSGFNSALALGMLHSFENDRESINEVRRVYGRRLLSLIGILSEAGMKLAVDPGAGFFSLWLLPKRAFGEDITSAEQFNRMMIERTGIVGVHFHPYVRYAVCGPDAERIDEIATAFAQASVEY